MVDRMGGSCFRFLRFIAVSALRRFFTVVKTGAGPGLLLYSFFPGKHPPSSIRSYNWRTASREGLPPPLTLSFLATKAMFTSSPASFATSRRAHALQCSSAERWPGGACVQSPLRLSRAILEDL